MAVLDNIKAVEAYVGELQNQLGDVETLLEQVEGVAVEGKKAGRCLRRMVRLLLLAAVIAAIVVAVKKILGCRSPEQAAVDETIIDEVAVDEAGNVIDEVIAADVVVAADDEVAEEDDDAS